MMERAVAIVPSVNLSLIGDDRRAATQLVKIVWYGEGVGMLCSDCGAACWDPRGSRARAHDGVYWCLRCNRAPILIFNRRDGEEARV